MEKKRRKSKGAGKADFKLQSRQPQPEINVLAKPAQKPGILTDKDRQILDDVQNIIWDPARLNKFKNDGNAAKADGLSKSKKPVK